MSNRLTFSLASLIFLIAFGLVFAPTSVLAHEARSGAFDAHHDGKGADANTAGTGTAADLTGAALLTETGHRHGPAPTVTMIELVDVKIGADAAAKATGDSTVSDSGTSVVLVSDANAAAADPVTKTDLAGTTAGEFRIKITFSHDVYFTAAQEDNFGAPLADTTLAADLIENTAITDVAASKAAMNVRIDDLDIPTGDLARMAGSSKVFLATVIVPAANLTDVPMDVWIGVNANAVATKGQFSAGQNTHGRGNAEASQQMFTIVDELPPETPPSTPTKKLTIAPGSNVKSVMMGKGEIAPSGVSSVEFTLTSATALTAAPSLSVMVNGAPLDGTRYSVTGSGTMWTLRVLVNAVTDTITVSGGADFDLQQVVPPDTMPADITGDMFTVSVDPMGPKVMDIRAPAGLPASGGAFTVRIEFDEPLAALADTDFTVKNGSISDIRLVQPGIYVATVTPDAGVVKTNADATKQSVEVRLNAGVMDEHGNASMATAATAPADGSFMPEMATTAPNTVMIAATAGATPTATFDATLTFTQAVSALAATNLDVTGGTAGTPAKDTTTTDGTVWKVTITPTAGSGGTVMIAVKASVATGTAKTVTLPTITAEMLNAGDYLVVVRDKTKPPSFGNLSPDLVSWSEVSDEAEMPDLEELFDVGGTIQLKVTGATRLQVVFSEVMWAVDQGNVDNRAMYLGEQWIELHNRSDKNFPISDIKIKTQKRRPALAEETDRISNVVGAGEDWVLGKGQNGNSGINQNGVIVGQEEFISMYRNNEGEPGHQSSRWTKSTELYATNHRGTPGQKERAGVQIVGTTTVPRSPIIFNEIGHHSNPKYEWIELRNVSGGNVNLKNYEVTLLKGLDDDADFIDFTGADRNVPAGGILLVVKNDPTGDPDHPLAAGWNFGVRNTWTVAKPGEAHYVPGVNENSARYMKASSFGDLPDNGEFVLVLRNRQDRNGSTGNDNIRDIAGHIPGTRLQLINDTWFTNLWPLSNFHNANAVQNKFSEGTVHRRQHAGVNGTDRSRRDRGANADDGAFRDDGWSGIGYKRNAAADAENGGTPGHPDSAHARHNRFDATTRSSVIVSEIMIDQGPRNLPEWIELFNTSYTEAVSVNGWRITVTNHDMNSADGGVGSFTGDLTISFRLGNHVIPPRQSYLIVARSARNNTRLPKERIHSVNRRAGQLLLNTYGFQIKVEAWEKDSVYHAVDTIGNLGPAPANDRRSNAQSFEPISWMLPNTISANRSRISLVRVSDTMGPIDGMTKGAWNHFDMSQQLGRTLDATSYGHTSDQGSPGHNVGGVLPVELSMFRPQRLDDGSVAIRWATESELDNAGFNILRSDTRDGQFTKLNTQLIAGQGTTSERTAYEFVDKTAKPNVVYYYQIQDVSIDGDIQVLKVTHLRGHVSPSGKATTTWGELKSLQ